MKSASNCVCQCCNHERSPLPIDWEEIFFEINSEFVGEKVTPASFSNYMNRVVQIVKEHVGEEG